MWPKITDLGTSPTLAFFGWVVTVVVIFRHYLYSTCLHPNIWVTYITICIQLPGSMLNIQRTSMEPPSATATTTHFKSSYHKNNNKKTFSKYCQTIRLVVNVWSSLHFSSCEMNLCACAWSSSSSSSSFLPSLSAWCGAWKVTNKPQLMGSLLSRLSYFVCLQFQTDGRTYR